MSRIARQSCIFFQTSPIFISRYTFDVTYFLVSYDANFSQKPKPSGLIQKKFIFEKTCFHIILENVSPQTCCRIFLLRE